MNIDELKAKKDEYITGLEKILKDWGKYLICPSDRKLIDATMLVVEGEYNSQLVVHNSTGKNDFTFKGNHKFDNVKSLIIAHGLCVQIIDFCPRNHIFQEYSQHYLDIV